jgi:predicted S18 family serine protease
MVVALASLLTGRPVRSDLAMTGEISLRGLVLPIGGVKEKVLAMLRAGIRTVMLPARNRRDLEDIPPTRARSSRSSGSTASTMRLPPRCRRRRGRRRRRLRADLPHFAARVDNSCTRSADPRRRTSARTVRTL